MLDFLWVNSIQVVVSRTNFDKKLLNHFVLEPDTILLENKLGIKEPVDAKETSLDQIEAFLIPLLVCDRHGFRIGYGGGYYDRMLKETKALKVGLSLSPPVDKIMQQEAWDIPLDYLITPYKTYNYG